MAAALVAALGGLWRRRCAACGGSWRGSAARGGLALAAGLGRGGSGGRTGGAEGLGKACFQWFGSALGVARCGLARFPGRLAWGPWAAGLGTLAAIFSLRARREAELAEPPGGLPEGS